MIRGGLDEIHVMSIINKICTDTSWETSLYKHAINISGSLRKNDSIIYRSDKSQINVRISFTPYVTELTHGGFFLFHDTTAQIKFEETLLHMATHDPLTGLPNRTLFKENIITAINRSQRSNKPFIDADYFKKINDEFGHVAGDSIIRQIAARLQEACRDCDNVARLRGDEFGILFEDIRDEPDIANIAERLLPAAIIVSEDAVYIDGQLLLDKLIANIKTATTAEEMIEAIKFNDFDCIIVSLDGIESTSFLSELLTVIQNTAAVPTLVHSSSPFSPEQNTELHTLANEFAFIPVISNDSLLIETSLFLHQKP